MACVLVPAEQASAMNKAQLIEWFRLEQGGVVLFARVAFFARIDSDTADVRVAIFDARSGKGIVARGRGVARRVQAGTLTTFLGRLGTVQTKNSETNLFESVPVPPALRGFSADKVRRLARKFAGRVACIGAGHCGEHG